MVKKLVAAGLCAAVIMVSSAAMAADVVVTKRGKKYHQPTCALILKKETSTMDEKQAQAKGLTPCAKCFKVEEKESKTK